MKKLWFVITIALGSNYPGVIVLSGNCPGMTIVLG